jgi:hypothetical protein
MDSKDQWIEDIINTKLMAGGAHPDLGSDPMQSAQQVRQIEVRIQRRLQQQTRQHRVGVAAAACVVIVTLLGNWALVRQLDHSAQTSSAGQMQQVHQGPNLPLPLGADLLEHSIYDTPTSHEN